MTAPPPGYAPDLAYVHDAGFTGFARRAAPGLLAMLRRAGIRRGLVVDVGCGTGVWARRLTDEGYRVVGIDLSPAMLAIARSRAPEARFVRGSFVTVPLPPCQAITAMGECFNYTFDRESSIGAVGRFFARAHAALGPGGLLVFDVLEPGRRPPRRGWSEGDDWAILVESAERARWLTRRMTIFRKVGRRYRRTEAVHRVRLYDRDALARLLGRAGFDLEIRRGYGRWPLADHHLVFAARKAGASRRPA